MLRVLTLNIWNLSGDWRARRAEIVAWIDRLEPDVVCLQEVLETPAGNQAAWLAEAAAGDWHCTGGGADVGEDARFGNAVLSRRPIDVTTVAELPGADAPDDLQRVVVHARTGGLDVYSTHLAWRLHVGAVREAQVAALVEFVDATADPGAPLPAIVAGDFNAEPESAEIRFLTGLRSLGGRSTFFQDAWRIAGGRGPGWTWDNRNPFAAADREPSRRIDYVLVAWRRDNGAGVVERAAVACDRSLTGTFASDHYGVVADIVT